MTRMPNANNANHPGHTRGFVAGVGTVPNTDGQPMVDPKGNDTMPTPTNDTAIVVIDQEPTAMGTALMTAAQKREAEVSAELAAMNAIIAPAVDQDELLPTDGEPKSLPQYEAIVRRGLKGAVEAGRALEAIKVRELWKQRPDTNSWSQYLREAWGFSKQYADTLRKAAIIGQIVSNTDAKLPPVLNERQTRPLNTVKDQPKLVVEVWRHATENGKKLDPSGADVAASLKAVQDKYAANDIAANNTTPGSRTNPSNAPTTTTTTTTAKPKLGAKLDAAGVKAFHAAMQNVSPQEIANTLTSDEACRDQIAYATEIMAFLKSYGVAARGRQKELELSTAEQPAA